MKGKVWLLWPAAVAVLSLCAMTLASRPALRELTALPAAEATAAPAEGERIDLNTADLDTLMTLPGIGEARARAILEYRDSKGPFRYPEDLINVPGIGEETLYGLLDLITTGGV